MDKRMNEKEGKNESCTFFIAPSMFIKTLLSLCGSREICVTQRQLSFSPRNYATFNQMAQKQDSKKDKVRDGNPFSIHYAQPVDRGGA